jgi:capsular polysaccharide export protein
MIPASLDRLLAQRRTLLLQGPMGPFFAHLAKTLRAHGQEVWKVNFNAGDDHYYRGSDVLPFSGTAAEWSAWLQRLIAARRIDAIVVFGQTRELHEQALRVARSLGVTAYVFEEGYFRPDYVTLELGGVNAESSIPRDAAFYRALNIEAQPTPQPTHQNFSEVADMAMIYATELWKGRDRYPHYVHHRCLHPIREGLRWVRGGWRKWVNRWLERAMQARLSAPEMHDRFFLVPLQVHNDSQVLRHSRFASVPAFIEEVLQSFAEDAPLEAHLVFKHHPLDRPYNDYRKQIRRQATQLGLETRVHYIHDQHLPTLLQHARGVVTINSTTGLQALYHDTPVIALGECLYGVPGLVHAGPLADFWHEPGKVDQGLFQRFRSYLIRETQLNASFYGRTPGLPVAASRRYRSLGAAVDETDPGGGHWQRGRSASSARSK